MVRTIVKQGLFAPNPSKQESKAQLTNSIAKSIVDAEATSREAKTARLRALRLKQETETPPQPAKAPAKKRVKDR